MQPSRKATISRDFSGIHRIIDRHRGLSSVISEGNTNAWGHRPSRRDLPALLLPAAPALKIGIRIIAPGPGDSTWPDRERAESSTWRREAAPVPIFDTTRTCPTCRETFSRILWHLSCWSDDKLPYILHGSFSSDQIGSACPSNPRTRSVGRTTSRQEAVIRSYSSRATLQLDRVQ